MVAVVAEFDAPTERLEAEVCTLAAQLAAATCRFLLLIAELDRREAWSGWGCRSMAHWLSYRCGLSLSTAREHVRVGRALAELPEVTSAFSQGTLSYSKVRALVRIATPERESELLELAQITTASQLERIVGAYVGTTRSAAESQLARRSLRMHTEDDGSVVITMRLPAEPATVLRAALEAALEEVPADASADADDPIAARRADAFELIARSYVDGGDARAPRAEVVMHGDVATLCDDEHGELLRSMACDAGLTLHIEDRGKTLDVGRRTRTIPTALRRAIERRDKGCCRFPGCSNRRYLHVHHLLHFAHGGPTRADNLILLCTFHHRILHIGGWRVRGRADGELQFTAPNGRVMPEHPPVSRATGPIRGPRVDATTITTADGGRLDLDHAVTALVARLPPHPN